MLHVREFGNPRELEHFLQGNIVGGRLITHPQGVNVRGLTLTFSTPAVTVTFPNTVEFEHASAAQIVSEINTQASLDISTIAAYGYGLGNGGQVVLNRSGDVLTGGTALAALGLATGTVGGTAVALASVAQVFSHNSRYCLVYNV